MAQARLRPVKVELRDVTAGDLPVLFEHQLDPDATTMAAFPSRDRAAFDAHWSRILADKSLIAKAIVADGKLVGHIGAYESEGRWLIGYWVGKEYWGKGIATRALELFLSEVKERPIHAFVAAHNVGSIRVLAKCGFTEAERGQTEGGGESIEEVVLVLDAAK